MRNCSKCQTLITDDGKFCPKCGAVVAPSQEPANTSPVNNTAGKNSEPSGLDTVAMTQRVTPPNPNKPQLQTSNKKTVIAGAAIFAITTLVGLMVGFGLISFRAPNNSSMASDTNKNASADKDESGKVVFTDGSSYMPTNPSPKPTASQSPIPLTSPTPESTPTPVPTPVAIPTPVASTSTELPTNTSGNNSGNGRWPDITAVKSKDRDKGRDDDYVNNGRDRRNPPPPTPDYDDIPDNNDNNDNYSDDSSLDSQAGAVVVRFNLNGKAIVQLRGSDVNVRPVSNSSIASVEKNVKRALPNTYSRVSVRERNTNGARIVLLEEPTERNGYTTTVSAESFGDSYTNVAFAVRWFIPQARKRFNQ